MTAVAKVVTDAFLMLLSVLAAPQSLHEYRIDAVSEKGYMDTMIVRKIQDGFELYDQVNHELVKYVTIQTSKEAPGAYDVIVHRDHKEETINPSDVIRDFDLMKLRTATQLTWTASDGSEIRLNRSGDIAYLTPQGRHLTFVVHCYPATKNKKDD